MRAVAGLLPLSRIAAVHPSPGGGSGWGGQLLARGPAVPQSRVSRSQHGSQPVLPLRRRRTEGRAASGATDLSSSCVQNPTLPGHGAATEAGGTLAAQLSLLQPHSGPHGSQLHLAVAEDLAEVVAGHCKGVSLGVAETGAADLGVGDALGVAVLDLRGNAVRGTVN